MTEPTDVADRMRPETHFPGNRRRRSFLAASASSAGPFAELPAVETETENEDGDLPLLTEIIPLVVAAPETSADRLDDARLSLVAGDLVHALEQQLAIELPALIEASLLNAQNELRAGISRTLNTALRDFLARRQQLDLPLGEAPQESLSPI